MHRADDSNYNPSIRSMHIILIREWLTLFFFSLHNLATTSQFQLTLVCYDSSSSPPTRIDFTSKLILPDLSAADSANALKLVYETLSKYRSPKRWGDVDKSMLHYRLESWDADQHCPLVDDESFKAFWTHVCGQAEGGGAVQLVVHGKRNTGGNATNGGKKKLSRIIVM